MTTAHERSSLGMEANVAALLSYVLGIVSGLIFFLLEKRSAFVRFHAMQAILFSAALFVLSLVVSFSSLLSLLVSLAGVILWIILMVKAYRGEQWKLPVLGDVAERRATPKPSA